MFRDVKLYWLNSTHNMFNMTQPDPVYLFVQDVLFSTVSVQYNFAAYCICYHWLGFY